MDIDEIDDNDDLNDNDDIPKTNEPLSLKVYAMERVFHIMTNAEQNQVLSRINPAYDFVAIDIPYIRDMHKRMLTDPEVRTFFDNDPFVGIFIDGKFDILHANFYEKKALENHFDKYLHNCLILRDVGIFEANMILKIIKDRKFLETYEMGIWFHQEVDFIDIRNKKNILLTLYYD